LHTETEPATKISLT